MQQQINPLSNYVNNNMNMNNRNNNPMQMVNEFMKFAKNFKGNPQQEVMNMLNNGQMSQQQFEQLSQQANQIQEILKQFGIK